MTSRLEITKAEPARKTAAAGRAKRRTGPTSGSGCRAPSSRWLPGS